MKLERIPGSWVIEAFRRGGINIDELTQKHPDNINTLLYNMYSMPPDDINQLLLACSEMNNDIHFGLTMNERIDITMYGLIGYIMLNSSTGQDLCKNIAKYYSIFYCAGPAFKFTTQKDHAFIHFETNRPENISHRHQIEWSLGAIPYFLSQSLGELSKPLSTSFRFDPPENLDKLKSIFGHNIKFNQNENKLVYKKPILHRKISNVNPSVLKVLIDEADTYLNNIIKNKSLHDKIKLLLIERISGDNANASDIAKVLNLTLSTFKRYMIKENIDFRKIKEDIKNDLAKNLLRKTSENINGIARKTGFSDQSSFTRFFIRCNKMPPQTFRDKLSK